MTPYGWRKQRERRSESDGHTTSTPRWVALFAIVVILVVLLFRFLIRPVGMGH
jgi:hypothetical protein